MLFVWRKSHHWPGGLQSVMQCAILTERKVVDLPSPCKGIQLNQRRAALLRPPGRKNDSVPMSPGRLEHALHVSMREPGCHETGISRLAFSISQRPVPKTAVVLVVREVPGYRGCVFAGQCRTQCPHRLVEPAIHRYSNGAMR